MSYETARAAATTSFCRCFRVERHDGATFGFTDHDRELVFAGVSYHPGTALEASEAAARLGMAPDDLDASGALSDAGITEADLAAGLWDGAEVSLYEVDWSDVSSRSLLGRYTIGQVSRGPLAFTAELRSLAAGLDRSEGRIHAVTCDCKRLGDARCKLALGPWTATVTITAVARSGAVLTVTAGSGFAATMLARGIATLADGAEIDIRAAATSGSGWIVSLWEPPGVTPEVGQVITLVAGCDRSADTCESIFGNFVNFRGFPHMPGAEALTSYAVPGDPRLDGGSRF